MKKIIITLLLSCNISLLFSQNIFSNACKFTGTLIKCKNYCETIPCTPSLVWALKIETSGDFDTLFIKRTGNFDTNQSFVYNSVINSENDVISVYGHLTPKDINGVEVFDINLIEDIITQNINITGCNNQTMFEVNNCYYNYNNNGTAEFTTYKYDNCCLQASEAYYTTSNDTIHIEFIYPFNFSLCTCECDYFYTLTLPVPQSDSVYINYNGKTLKYKFDATNTENIDNDISVYPTVAKDYITINLNKDIDNISILNSGGDVVLFKVTPNKSIEVSDLKPGNYSIVIHSNNKVYSQKFIKL